jgi:hypothetical protein
MKKTNRVSPPAFSIDPVLGHYEMSILTPARVFGFVSGYPQADATPTSRPDEKTKP